MGEGGSRRNDYFWLLGGGWEFTNWLCNIWSTDIHFLLVKITQYIEFKNSFSTETSILFLSLLYLFSILNTRRHFWSNFGVFLSKITFKMVYAPESNQIIWWKQKVEMTDFKVELGYFIVLLYVLKLKAGMMLTRVSISSEHQSLL